MKNAKIKKQLNLMLDVHGVKGVDVDKLTADVEALVSTVSSVEAQPMVTRRTVDTDRRLERLREALGYSNKAVLHALRGTFDDEECFLVDMALDVLKSATDAALQDATPKKRGGVKMWYPMILGAFRVFKKHFTIEPTTVEDGLFADLCRVCYRTQDESWPEVELHRRIKSMLKICRIMATATR